jgi:excisionase family DNA binding protein
MTTSEELESSASVELLTVAEACATLRISRWSLYRLIQAKRLESIQIGRRRLVPGPAVRHLIDELRAEAHF